MTAVIERININQDLYYLEQKWEQRAGEVYQWQNLKNQAM